MGILACNLAGMQLIITNSEELQRIIEASLQKALAESTHATTVTTDSTKLLNIHEVADLLQVSVSSVNTYKKQGSIPFYRMGRRVFFKESEVLDCLKRVSRDGR